MKQLGNQDAGFVYNETPTTPMHIAGLGIYDQSTAPGGRLGHKDILKYVQDRIHIAPIFRYKFVEVPFGLDKPYWIEDPDFDIEFHIRHIALPQPGDWRQLCILVSRLNSRPLDFSRPLWEAYVIEGLDNIEGLPKGSFAIMVKVHHAIVDGASGQAIFGALHDLSPDGIASVPDKPLTVDRNPTALELIGRAVPNMISRPVSQTAALYKKAPNLIRNAIRLYKGEMKSGAKLRVPQTRFNYNISPHRVFEGIDFALDDIKYIKNTIGQGTTVNDVMLDIVAGGMRKYLEHHKELPDESLCAMLPQDVRTEKTRDDFGNQVGGMFADLHTDIADPIDRLVAIHQSTDDAKRFAQEMDTAAIVQNYMGGFLNPRSGRAFNRLIQNSRLMERFGPFACNTLITNVPGPNFPLYHAGARMVAYWGIPPLMDCLGLGHAIFSYCGRISLSVMACRQTMPDPGFYASCLREAFEELHDAAKRYQSEVQKADAEKPQRKTTRRRAASSSSSASQPAVTDSSAEAGSEQPASAAPRKRATRKRSASSAAGRSEPATADSETTA
ncbi:MAG TPA: wax ester/triacylglycerol synthase family O-acyltransferase [Pseudomonadales bacterium]